MRNAALTAVVAAALLTVWGAAAPQAPPAKEAAEIIWTPYDSVRLALADALAVAAVDPNKAYDARYISLYNVSPARRLDYWRIISFLLNSLSQEKLITRPAIIPGTDNTVIRFFLGDYRIKSAAFDRLVANGSGPEAQAFPEPYFHATAIKVVDEYVEELIDEYKDQEYGHWEYARGNYGRGVGRQWVTTETRREKTGKQVPSGKKIKTGKKSNTKIQVTAPWLATPDGGAAIDNLVAVTQTQNPIVRGDWFLAYASWATTIKNQAVGYYDLLGLGNTLADIEKQFFASEKDAARARSNLQGNVVFSSVALHNRALVRLPSIATPLGGYFWFSHDTAKSIDDRDYCNVLLNQKFDATEDIFSLFNGLQGYAVTNGVGARLDLAVAGIAIDSETPLADRQVYSARNCISCHSRGMRPIQDEVRHLARKDIGLLVADPDQAAQIFDLYFSVDLDPILKHDMATYEVAVRQTNDLSPLANGKQFEKFIWTYLDQPLDAKAIAREAGVIEAVLMAKLSRALNVDHTLTGLLQTPPRPVRRDQFEVVFAELQMILAGP
jgi:hypothetical protein